MGEHHAQVRLSFDAGAVTCMLLAFSADRHE
jgi:hypothetical protein